MEQAYINSSELKDFVSYHNLSNSHSVIHFRALVSITTEINMVRDLEVEVRINFQGYDNFGTISLFEKLLDEDFYPTVYQAKWQKMKHVDNVYFMVNDVHDQNKNIGKYEVKIIPLGRLSD